MQAEDLRTWWASASPRERNERVALALGWSIRPMLAVPKRRTWHNPEGHPQNVPPYAASWEHAGPLLDRLRSQGFCVTVEGFCEEDRGEAGAWQVIVSADLPTLEAEAATAPEAIALAFCLAKEPPHG